MIQNNSCFGGTDSPQLSPNLFQSPGCRRDRRRAASERFALGASPGDTLRIALVGCGGRGSGAADQALSTSGGVKLVAMADVFKDRMEESSKT